MKKLSEGDINSCIAAGFPSLVIFGLVSGSSRLSSLLFVDLIARYNVDRERASFPFILCIMTKSSVGPMVGFAVKKFGLRLVTITGCFSSAIAIGGCFFAKDITTITVLWGVIYGISFGFGTLSIPHYLSFHFSKHLDKANGITYAGDSVCYFVLSLLVEYCLYEYGLSGTFLIISGVILHSVPAAFLLKTQKESRLESPTEMCDCQKMRNDLKEHNSSFETTMETYNNTGIHSPTEKCDCQEMLSKFKENTSSETKNNAIEAIQQKSAIHTFRVFLDPVYILIVVMTSAMIYNYSTIYTILLDLSRDHGVPIDYDTYLFLAASTAELFGRLFLGSLTDAGYLTKMNFVAIGFAGLGLLYAAVVWIKGFAMMMVFAFFFGLLIGGINIVNAGVVTFYIDKEYHCVAVPSRFILYPFASFTQAPLIGYFRDTLKSYDGLFYMLIGVCCISSFICLIIPHIIVWKKNRSCFWK